MRVAVDACVLSGNWGGIPKYLSRIAVEMARQESDVTLLANARSFPRQVPGTREVAVRVRGRGLWREAFLPLWLAARRPDVLWAPESVLPRWSPVPSVVTVHDLAPLRLPGTKPPEHVERLRTAVGRSVARADLVITVSATTADEVTSIFGTDPGKLRVIPAGVDEVFTPGDRAAATAAVRERWGISAPFVLHVGSLEPRKGLDVLIEAAALAHQRGRDWRVVLAGSAGYRGAQIEAAARAAEACDVLGAVDEDELLDLMRAAGALAAPALHEGFGSPPLEAMACGVPVVLAADSGGLEETSGKASIVVAERTAEAWLEALERGLRRPPELIERGHALAARFRWPEVAREVREVLGEAAER